MTEFGEHPDKRGDAETFFGGLTPLPNVAPSVGPSVEISRASQDQIAARVLVGILEQTGFIDLPKPPAE